MRAGQALINATAIGTFACALTITVLVVRKELMPPSPTATSTAPEKLDAETWREIQAEGHRMGATTPMLTVVEFSDFECPFCRRYNEEVLKPLLAKHPDRVSVVFQHYPLPYHRFAVPTARAAECAAQQGRFREFHDVALANQDSLGLKTYRAMAAESVVPDLDAFDTCIATADFRSLIDQDRELGSRAGVTGTPGVFVNGSRYPAPPSLPELEALLNQ